MPKPSYLQSLIRTPRQRSIYFWVRRVASFLFALSAYAWLKAYIIAGFAFFLAAIVFFVIYAYVSHYIALIVLALEDMMS